MNPTLLVLTLTILHAPVATEIDDADVIRLVARSRAETAADSGTFEVRETAVRWNSGETAIIVCDMWDAHHCLNAVRRVTELAPRMNQVLESARSRGVLIVHAPSSCMEPYNDHPARKRAQAAPRAANLPKDIGDWCRQIPSEEKGKYPIDQTDGGEDDDPAEHKSWHERLAAMGRNPKSPWKTQVDVLKIHDEDAISDSGVEIWNLLEQRGIQNVILLGVHTNMCVLGRPFGLRQMAKNGKKVVLMRDMTDTMYNPERAPFVSHFRGTDLIVEHIEKYVCPTITSDQLVGGAAFTFEGDVRPRVVLAISEDEYKTNETLPKFAVEVLETQLGLRATVLQADSNNGHVIPGLAAALEQADLLFVSIRRRALPADDLAAVRSYLASGRPLVAIRTASHAFDARGKGPAGHAEWPTFDPDVLGGNYKGHHGDGPKTKVATSTASAKQPILAGVETPFESSGSLYKVSPLASSATPLLVGSIPGQPAEPVAWTNKFGKSRVFYTSLGHSDDFRNPQFVRLLGNAVSWALENARSTSRTAAGN